MGSGSKAIKLVDVSTNSTCITCRKEGIKGVSARNHQVLACLKLSCSNHILPRTTLTFNHIWAEVKKVFICSSANGSCWSPDWVWACANNGSMTDPVSDLVREWYISSCMTWHNRWSWSLSAGTHAWATSSTCARPSTNVSMRLQARTHAYTYTQTYARTHTFIARTQAHSQMHEHKHKQVRRDGECSLRQSSTERTNWRVACPRQCYSLQHACALPTTAGSGFIDTAH